MSLYSYFNGCIHNRSAYQKKQNNTMNKEDRKTFRKERLGKLEE